MDFEWEAFGNAQEEALRWNFPSKDQSSIPHQVPIALELVGQKVTSEQTNNGRIRNINISHLIRPEEGEHFGGCTEGVPLMYALRRKVFPKSLSALHHPFPVDEDSSVYTVGILDKEGKPVGVVKVVESSPRRGRGKKVKTLESKPKLDLDLSPSY